MRSDAAWRAEVVSVLREFDGRDVVPIWVELLRWAYIRNTEELGLPFMADAHEACPVNLEQVRLAIAPVVRDLHDFAVQDVRWGPMGILAAKLYGESLNDGTQTG